jgi:serine/threonine protein kinase
MLLANYHSEGGANAGGSAAAEKAKREAEEQARRAAEEQERERQRKAAEEADRKQREEALERQRLAAIGLFANIESSLRSGVPCVVPYTVLSEWTNGFQSSASSHDSPFGKLGEGSYGVVYKALATSPEGTGNRAVRLAVKVIQGDLTAGSAQPSAVDGMTSFRREVNVLSRFHHPNIVKLVGCSEGDKACLVYELLALGGLNGILTDDLKARNLDWKTRVNVLLQVSTALNYLHRHNSGNPAYHRDVKAANIALTSTYEAKLIDCGLAKYVADDGTGGSIRTATGFRFGTIGYMCPSYCKGKPYDDKSEVYSFGIVILEVLTGKLQNKEGILLEETIGEIPADVRAGPWPEDCSAALFKLAEDCTAEYRRRISTMATVMRVLREIRDRFCAPSAQETVFQQRLEALQVETDALSLARDAVLSTHRECLVCYETGAGVACKGAEGHFLCRECFSSMVNSQSNDFGGFTSNRRHIVCSYCRAEYPESDVCGTCDNTTLIAYLDAKERAVRIEEESRAAGQLAIERAAHQDEMMALEARLLSDQAERRAKTVERHRKKIISDILETRCPHCQLAFEDWEACFAVKHEGVMGSRTFGCLKYFCGWCLGPFEDSSSCHEHVKSCRLNHNPTYRGGYYGSMAAFHSVQATVRRDKIQRYIATSVEEGDRTALLSAMQTTDLAPLGIDL